MKYLPVYALLMLVFYNPCEGQNQTELPTDTVKSGTKGISTSFGPTTSVRTIIQDRKGNIWLASNEGIIRYDGKSFTNITGDYFPDRFFSVLEDRKENFWFGNYGSGAYYYDASLPDGQGKPLQHFTTREGLIDNRVWCIYEDRAGMIWFGTGGGVSRYDARLPDGQGKSFRNFTTKDGLPNHLIYSIMEDKSGKLWFGTSGYTYIYDRRTFKVFRDNEGNPFNNVWSIIEDKNGNIWLGGNGLWRYDGSTFTNFTKNAVRYVYEDKKGNIWTSGLNGNGKFAFSRYEAKSLSDKELTVTEIAQSLNLFGILEANDGSIWFGAYDGVYRYDASLPDGQGNAITDFKR